MSINRTNNSVRCQAVEDDLQCSTQFYPGTGGNLYRVGVNSQQAYLCNRHAGYTPLIITAQSQYLSQVSTYNQSPRT